MHFKCLLADSQWRLFASFKHHQDLLLSTIFCIGTTFCISRSSALLLRKNHFLFNHDDGSFGSLNLAFLSLLNLKQKPTSLIGHFWESLVGGGKNPIRKQVSGHKKWNYFFALLLQWRIANFPSGLNGHHATEVVEKEFNQGQELWYNILHPEGRHVRP